MQGVRKGASHARKSKGMIHRKKKGEKEGKKGKPILNSVWMGVMTTKERHLFIHSIYEFEYYLEFSAAHTTLASLPGEWVSGEMVHSEREEKEEDGRHLD